MKRWPAYDNHHTRSYLLNLDTLSRSFASISHEPIPNHSIARLAPLLVVCTTTPTLHKPNLSRRKSIRRIPIRRHEIDTKRVRPRRDKEAQRHPHRPGRRIIQIRRRAQQRRHTGSPTHASNDETAAALRVLAQSAHAQRHDGGEADGLEEQGQVQHGHAGVVALRDAGRDEDDAHAEVHEEDPAGSDAFHDCYAGEAAESEGALGAGEEFGAQGAVGVRAGFGDVVDELGWWLEWQGGWRRT